MKFFKKKDNNIAPPEKKEEKLMGSIPEESVTTAEEDTSFEGKSSEELIADADNSVSISESEELDISATEGLDKNDIDFINSLEITEENTPEEIAALEDLKLLDELSIKNSDSKHSKKKRQKRKKEKGISLKKAIFDVNRTSVTCEASEKADIDAATTVSVDNNDVSPSDEEKNIRHTPADILTESDTVETDVIEIRDETAKDDDTEKKKTKRRLKAPAATRAVIAVVIIFAFLSTLLGVVNHVTKHRISDNTEKVKRIAVLAAFDFGTSCKPYKTIDGKEVYLVHRGDDIVGYAVFVSPDGYNGSIDMVVGIDADYRTVGVEIVTMSETSAIGAKIKSAEFRNQFIGGMKGDPLFGVDTISGATVSSSAVCTGVFSAHEINIDLEAIAENMGIKLLRRDDLTDSVSFPDTSAPIPESAPTEDTVSTDSDSITVIPSETAKTEPPVTEDIPGVDYGDGKHYSYNVNFDTAENKYVIEIDKENETATASESETEEPEKVTTEAVTTPAATTKKPETTPAPETTAEPETTSVPETTLPETAAEPETTPAPETTPPETTAEPDTSDFYNGGNALDNFFGKSR